MREILLDEFPAVGPDETGGAVAGGGGQAVVGAEEGDLAVVGVSANRASGVQVNELGCGRGGRSEESKAGGDQDFPQEAVHGRMPIQPVAGTGTLIAGFDSRTSARGGQQICVGWTAVARTGLA